MIKRIINNYSYHKLFKTIILEYELCLFYAFPRTKYNQDVLDPSVIHFGKKLLQYGVSEAQRFITTYKPKRSYLKPKKTLKQFHKKLKIRTNPLVS